MINLVALFLVATSLLSGGFFTPEKQPANNPKREDLITKEGNKIIMVEYGGEHIPPPPSPTPAPAPAKEEPSLLEEKLDIERSIANSAIDKLKGTGKQAASVLPNIGQGIAGTTQNLKPKDVICDALGKCKEKVAGVFSHVKEEGEGVKESVYDKAHKFGEAGQVVLEKGKEGLGLKKKEVEPPNMEEPKETFSDQVEDLKDVGKYVGKKTIENVKNLALGVKKGHNTLWDERSAKRKATSFFNEGRRNFTYFLNKGSHAFVDAAKYAVSKEAVNPSLGVAQLLGLATAYGMSVWVTFVSSHVLAGALPRQQFGVVQSKIYPVYFKALIGSIACSFIANAMRHRLMGLKTIQAYNMLVSLGMVLLNLLYFEPRATKVMFEKMKLEKEEGRGVEGEEIRESVTATPTPTATRTTTTTTEAEPAGLSCARREGEQEEVRSRLEVLNMRLQNLNFKSSLLNVLTLMSLTWQLVYYGRGLPLYA